jgi:hypothetical protein
MNDNGGTYYAALFNYKKNGCYPEGYDKKNKRALRKRAKAFVVDGSHLHYVGPKGTDSPRLVVEKKEEQVKILSRTHDISHLGRDKLLSVVQHKYYWPGLYTDATEYVRMYV